MLRLVYNFSDKTDPRGIHQTFPAVWEDIVRLEQIAKDFTQKTETVQQTRTLFPTNMFLDFQIRNPTLSLADIGTVKTENLARRKLCRKNASFPAILSGRRTMQFFTESPNRGISHFFMDFFLAPLITEFLPEGFFASVFFSVKAGFSEEAGFSEKVSLGVMLTQTAVRLSVLNFRNASRTSA